MRLTKPGSENAADLFDSFDLLPPSYHSHNRVRAVTGSWLTTICALLAVLVGVSAASILKTHSEHQQNRQIAATAIPLIKLRNDVLHLQEQNLRRDRWCRSVESSQPDDNALQTLAAVATASRQVHRDILIDALELRLPIEVPQAVNETPAWAIPRISVTARVTNRGSIAEWVDHLNRLDRIEAASIESGESSIAHDERSTRVNDPLRLTATPIATRVLP